MSRVKLEKEFTGIGATDKTVSLIGPFNLSVDMYSGSGTIQLQRSFDNGTTWKTTDKYTASVEDVGESVENSVRWRLNCSAYTSGTITARISQ